MFFFRPHMCSFLAQIKIWSCFNVDVFDKAVDRWIRGVVLIDWISMEAARESDAWIIRLFTIVNKFLPSSLWLFVWVSILIVCRLIVNLFVRSFLRHHWPVALTGRKKGHQTMVTGQSGSSSYHHFLCHHHHHHHHHYHHEHQPHGPYRSDQDFRFWIKRLKKVL